MAYYVAGSGSSPVTLTTGDLQIGAVEIKDEDSDDRAVVKTASTVADTDICLGVADPNLDAKVPALGAAAAAAAMPVTLATEDAAKVPALGSAADAASVPVTQSTEDKAVLASLNAKEVELDLTAAPTQVALTTTTARSSQLAVGRYIVKSDAPVFVRQGNVSSDATVTTDFKLEAGVCYVLNVTNTTNNGYLSGILGTGLGTMDIQATV
jgi:hypothetical protein